MAGKDSCAVSDTVTPVLWLVCHISYVSVEDDCCNTRVLGVVLPVCQL